MQEREYDCPFKYLPYFFWSFSTKFNLHLTSLLKCSAPTTEIFGFTTSTEIVVEVR